MSSHKKHNVIEGWYICCFYCRPIPSTDGNYTSVYALFNFNCRLRHQNDRHHYDIACSAPMEYVTYAIIALCHRQPKFLNCYIIELWQLHSPRIGCSGDSIDRRRCYKPACNVPKKTSVLTGLECGIGSTANLKIRPRLRIFGGTVSQWTIWVREQDF